jgi:hypothetical protein
MADIFISYAREDRTAAAALAGALEAHGFDVFWDREIAAGQRFDQVLAAELQAARCVIVLWSEAGVASHWVAEEAGAALEGNRLVPARLQDVEPPLGFTRIHAADLTGWNGDAGDDGFRQLLQDLRGRLGGAAVAATTTASPAATAADPARRRTTRRILAAFAAAGTVVVGLLLYDIRMLKDERASAPPAVAAAASAVDGTWQARVVYGWGATKDEAFNLRVIGDGALTGSASFLGVPRPIVEGRVEGAVVRFATRRGEIGGDPNVVNRYAGEIQGAAIAMVLTIEGGVSPSAPVAFVLERTRD